MESLLYCDMAAESRNGEQEETAVDRQLQGKQVAAATNTHATIEGPSKAMFSVRSSPRLHNEDER
jgi:hypothetical protein